MGLYFEGLIIGRSSLKRGSTVNMFKNLDWWEAYQFALQYTDNSPANFQKKPILPTLMDEEANQTLCIISTQDSIQLDALLLDPKSQGNLD